MCFNNSTSNCAECCWEVKLRSWKESIGFGISTLWCWSWALPAQETYCEHLLSVLYVYNDTLLVWKEPQWGYLQHGSWQTLWFFFSPRELVIKHKQWCITMNQYNKMKGTAFLFLCPTREFFRTFFMKWVPSKKAAECLNFLWNGFLPCTGPK